MGGNIFNGTRRYLKDEYYELENLVIAKLWCVIYTEEADDVNDYIRAIESYRTKDSFGDMDLVVCSENIKHNYIDLIIEEFNLTDAEHSKNGNVFSIVYKEFQVDIIVTQREFFQTSLNYFKFNDISNITGRIFKKFGVKHGHQGNYVVVRDGDRILGEIHVTSSMEEAHELISLDHSKWKAGFDTMEQAYDWVLETPYFNAEIYQYDNRNHYSRTRDRKRVNYHNFLLYIENKEGLHKYPYSDVTERDGYDIRYPFFDVICDKFPHVLKKYDEIICEHNKTKAFKEVFNGGIVMGLTGLQGKELGGFMDYCRCIMEDTGMKDTFHLSSEAVRVYIMTTLFDRYIKKDLE